MSAMSLDLVAHTFSKLLKYSSSRVILDRFSIAHMYTGKNPELDKVGMEAVEAVLREARRMARGLPAEKRVAIEAICSEIDQLAKELAELQARGEVTAA